MSKGGNYEVHRRFLKTVSFDLLILMIPDDEVEDKLTHLAGEKGQITKSLYEDFLVANCVANVNQLLFHLNQNVSNPPDFLEVRKELLTYIFEINPLLSPDKLVINRNNVVKVKGKRIKKDEILLTKNKSWESETYESLLEHVEKQPDKTPLKNLKAKKDIDSLDYKVVQKWWKRINEYVNIRSYSPEDVDIILGKRSFYNSKSFETFIVSLCIQDFERLFNMLEELGIPQRVPGPKLIHELYELCMSCNEFLTFENAQEFSDVEIEEPDVPSKAALAGALKRGSKNSKKRKFKDVPKEDILKLGDNMKLFLIGQGEAVDTIADSIQRASVGLKDPEKPLGSFLFAGRTGVGKTFASKVLANELIKNDKDNLITIDCSEYTADHEYSKLIGAPAGYIGHEHGGMLTNAVNKNPFSIVVFDEIEKASFKVHQLLLQILEEGRLTDGKGKPASFRDTLVIMTSNVGVKEIEVVQKTIGFGDAAKLTEKKKNLALKEALKKKFKPEFLNRIDAIVNFRNLVKKDYMTIIHNELYKLNDNLKTNDSDFKELELRFNKKIKEYIYKRGVNEAYGARPLKRCIEKEISTPLARKLLSGEVKENSTVLVTAYRGKVVFEEKDKVYNPPFYVTNAYHDLIVKASASETPDSWDHTS